jgi:hypothetical protein
VPKPSQESGLSFLFVRCITFYWSV